MAAQAEAELTDEQRAALAEVEAAFQAMGRAMGACDEAGIDPTPYMKAALAKMIEATGADVPLALRMLL